MKEVSHSKGNLQNSVTIILSIFLSSMFLNILCITFEFFVSKVLLKSSFIALLYFNYGFFLETFPTLVTLVEEEQHADDLNVIVLAEPTQVESVL